MSEWVIPMRDGIEVFVNKGGLISLKQLSEDPNSDVIVAVEPDDVPKLIRFLEAARQEAMNYRQEEADAEEENPTLRD